MGRNQILTLAGAVILLLGLYFIPIRPKQSKEMQESRALQMEATDKDALLQRAKGKYDLEQLAEVVQLNEMVASADGDTMRAEWLERLSGAWYKLGESALASIYAEEIAQIRQDEESWAIAGTSYALGIRNEGEERIRVFCRERAAKAFDNAISLNPENEQHRINKALCYVELPMEDHPMKGILMLRGVLDKNPDSVPALTQMGALAIQTGQYAKAIERLAHAHDLAPSNKRVIGLLAQAHQGMGDDEKAAKYQQLLKD